MSSEPVPAGAAPDWASAAAYRFTETLTRAQWVWEFLRRNPDYRRDWDWFAARWTALEAAYGQPPERDFQAWKQDPRAWVEAGEEDGECRIDQDKVLIECWMGAKWGFYKFPLDPALDNPVDPDRLSWRDPPQRVRRDAGDTDASTDRVSLVFELDLPLREQLERARRYLVGRQHRLLHEGRLHMRTRSALAPRWCLMLRYLDALAAGAAADAIEAGLNPGGGIGDFAALREQAARLARGGHVDMLAVLDE